MGEFVPVLAAEAFAGKTELAQQVEREGVNGAFGKAAGTEAAEAALAPIVHQRLRENAACGIAGAEEKDV